MKKNLLENNFENEKLKKLNIEELVDLSQEIREFLINEISKTGGHLASNLGVVELTVAMHYVFNSPYDKIIFDVGHQAYVHKILTGRKNEFSSLRQKDGLSGFPKRCESKHDIINSGHSSTSLSAALGICRARDLSKENFKVVSLIGDGALTGGMAFEALNDIGSSKTDITIILNDNGMSISKNVGGLSKYLSNIRLKEPYNTVKYGFEKITLNLPFIGPKIVKLVDFLKMKIKLMFLDNAFFEQIGFHYIGTVDGHNLNNLVEILKNSQKIKGPKLIHVATQKGKGYRFAENMPEKYHGVNPFSVKTGSVAIKKNFSYTNIFENKILKLMKNNEKIVAISAAMLQGTGLEKAKKEYPKRVFDVGIAEQHAVTMAAGLAVGGIKPYVCIYSTFLQRAYDQILHDVVLMCLPVVFIIDRAGIVGPDGETHHGLYDISFLSAMPNMVIMAPTNGKEFKKMLEFSNEYNDGPIAIRFPKSNVIQYDCKDGDIVLGKGELYKTGENVTIVALGSMISEVVKILPMLNSINIYPEIINPRFVKPFDYDLVENSIFRTRHLITIEEGILQGGLASIVNEKFKNMGIKIDNLGIDDRIIQHGTRDEMLADARIDSNSIFDFVKNNVKPIGDIKNIG